MSKYTVTGLVDASVSEDVGALFVGDVEGPTLETAVTDHPDTPHEVSNVFSMAADDTDDLSRRGDLAGGGHEAERHDALLLRNQAAGLGHLGEAREGSESGSEAVMGVLDLKEALGRGLEELDHFGVHLVETVGDLEAGSSHDSLGVGRPNHGDLGLGFAEDVAKLRRVGGSEERDGSAKATSASRTATAVQKRLRLLREVIVDDEVHIWDV